MKYRWLFVVALLLLAVLTAQSAPTYTYLDLVKRLTDLKYLSTLPAPGDTMAQWSSYDRASKYDAATDKYLAWDANGDGSGYIRQEGEQFVFAEMKGPGCIWRMWSAAPGAGHVRIYLDGATEPTVDLPFSGYFDGKTEPFTYPALVNNMSAGQNNYVPIPYQKSCKIVADKDWGAYFHFGYETFPEGTVVPTFRVSLSPEEKAALAQADGELSAPADAFIAKARAYKYFTIPAGGKVTVGALKGSGALSGMLIMPPVVPAADMEKVLRELAIQVKWDGEAEPSVWAPLGDFFGTGPGLNKYQSYPLGMTDMVFYSRWYMPYAKGAQVEIVNDGATERQLKVFLLTEPLAAADAAKLARFHAKWHRDAFLYQRPDRLIDWPMLKTDGRGRFVGVALNVWDPRGGWWGEGDEKFFVDGEKFPSTFGTGSEDYFGYAWGNPRLFSNAYHNQTRNDNTGNNGHIAVNRWHISDAVPFQTSFEADIEKYQSNKRPTQYDCTVYWYQAGGKDLYTSVPVAERVDYYTQVAIKNADGAFEGEALKILAGNAGVQEMSGFGADKWSGNMQLFWPSGKPGGKLVVALPVDADGKYQLTTVLTKADDYGIFQFSLDDVKLGDPVDLYNNGVIPSPVIDLGAHDLTKGEHKLTIENVGKNDAAKAMYYFGMDWIKLTPVK
ncbi:MAG TPA: glycoside hydrolase family 172 protein [Armatimonadota bacterium]|jgi:hypothetical protein